MVYHHERMVIDSIRFPSLLTLNRSTDNHLHVVVAVRSTLSHDSKLAKRLHNVCVDVYKPLFSKVFFSAALRNCVLQMMSDELT